MVHVCDDRALQFFPLPRDPLAYGEVTLLHVFSSEPYHNGPFLTYLDRHPGALFGEFGSGLQYLDDVQIHYQNWLFFDLLHECLGDLYDDRDYICRNVHDGKLWVTTHNLRRMLEEWSREHLEDILAADPGFSHFKECLEEVWRVLEITDRHFPGHGDLLGLQIDVIAATAEAITTTLRKHSRDFRPVGYASGHGCDWLAVSYQGRSDISDKCHDSMVERGGWCKNDIQRAMDRFPTVESWYYLRHLKLSDDCQRHQNCSFEECTVVSQSNNSMIPRHVQPGCRCKSVGVSSRRLSRVYLRGRIPCLEIRIKELDRFKPPGEDYDTAVTIRTLSVAIEDPERIPYVAISHVWSDGSGNGHGNWLPQCQVWRIYHRVNAWAADEGFSSDRFLLWIDTICCPSEQGKGKQVALARMKDIYQQAASVHVWDRSLTQWRSERSETVEAGARLFFSPWMRRLWTVQEAIFAGPKPDETLIIHMEDAWFLLTKLYRHAYKNQPFGSKFAEDLGFALMLLEKVFWPGGGGKSFQMLGLTAELLQHRSTSVAADEPLVLANILGFDVTEFLGLGHELGMSLFWSKVKLLGPGELQSGILFCPTPKLSLPGFRWAPRTFMNPSAFNPRAFFNSRVDPKDYTEITKDGLLVTLRGFRIIQKISPLPRCLLGGDVDYCGRNFDKVSFPLTDGSYVRVFRPSLCGAEWSAAFKKLYTRLRTGKLAFVSHMSEILDEPLTTHGLALEHKSCAENIHYASSEGHIGLEKLRQRPRQLHDAARKCAMRILQVLDEEAISRGGADAMIRTEALFDQHARQALADDPELCEVTRDNNVEDIDGKKHWSFEQVLEEFKQRVHHFAHVGPVAVIELSEHTKWCID